MIFYLNFYAMFVWQNTHNLTAFHETMLAENENPHLFLFA